LRERRARLDCRSRRERDVLQQVVRGRLKKRSRPISGSASGRSNYIARPSRPSCRCGRWPS
jgi:hypothetical protein